MGAETPLRPRRGYARKVEIDRAVKAFEASGKLVGSVEIHPDGRIILHAAKPGGIPTDAFEQWEDRL